MARQKTHVPLDPAHQELRFLALEVLVNRVHIIPVDLNFLHDGEGDLPLVRAEFHDFLLGAWFLAAKLVAREADNF